MKFQFFKLKNNKFTRSQLINLILKKYKYNSYLEIGVNTIAQPGFNYDSVNVKLKHGVDPNPKVKATFPVTSDIFFDKCIKQKYDLIFIDGLHIYEQAYRDIINSLNYLNKNGTIVVHDCNPVREITQRRVRASNVWHGDVWRAILRLRMENKDVSVVTVDTDEGCTIIKHGHQKLLNYSDFGPDVWSFSFFNIHRKEILNLISVEEFKRTV